MVHPDTEISRMDLTTTPGVGEAEKAVFRRPVLSARLPVSAPPELRKDAGQIPHAQHVAGRAFF
jgi:hypothetical protein